MTDALQPLAQGAGLTPAQLRAYLRERGPHLGRVIAADLRHRPLALNGLASAEPASREWDGGDFYRDMPNYGPQGQAAFVHRFLPTARDAAGVSGRLNFAKLFVWAGNIRELATVNTAGIFAKVLEMLGSNEIVSATNDCELHILKAPLPHDEIECRYWVKEMSDSDFVGVYEWWRIPMLGVGQPELFAWSQMRVCAVKVRDFGAIELTPWPRFFYDYLITMASGPKAGPGIAAPPASMWPAAQTLFAVPAGPNWGPKLHEHTFETTLEDSNVVGNIYFANYGVWQGRVRDAFFHTLSPALYRNRGATGELFCVHSSVQQLRDAMPFERIKVAMHLQTLTEYGVELKFRYFRLESQGAESLLAVSAHKAAWAKPQPDCSVQPMPWPAEILDGLKAYIGKNL